MIMKKLANNILVSTFILAVSLTSCFEEKDDDYVVIGAVASIPVFTISKNNPVAGEQVTVNIRYYSENVPVKEIRLTETIGAGTAAIVTTKTISDFDTEDSYLDSFPYVVPATAAGTAIRLTIEIQTTNDLVNSKFGNITVN